MLLPSFLEILITSSLNISKSSYFFCYMNKIDKNSPFFGSVGILMYRQITKVQMHT